MAKFVYKIPAHQWPTINHKLFKTKCCRLSVIWPLKIPCRLKKGILLRKQAQLSLPIKTLRESVETNISTKQLESNNYASTMPWKVFIASLTRALKMIRQYFSKSQRKTWSLQRVNDQILILLQPLRWCCVECVIHHERDVREEQHHTYTWREQAIIEWSWHVNSIVACCHGAKLCAYAARDFRSQQYIQFFVRNPTTSR